MCVYVCELNILNKIEWIKELYEKEIKIVQSATHFINKLFRLFKAVMLVTHSK